MIKQAQFEIFLRAFTYNKTLFDYHDNSFIADNFMMKLKIYLLSINNIVPILNMIQILMLMTH